MIQARTHCRTCGSTNLKLILDLGKTALVNDFLKPEDVPGYKISLPLRVVLCTDCSLVQLADKDERIVDRIATLKALDHVVFEDEKDGMLGMRVARWLESPTAGGGVFTDAHGVETKTDASSPDATGEYLTSEGVKGDAAWSTRGRWCSLTGHNKDGRTVTIAIFDQPQNPGYPTTWHARGYGLFAANPLGISIFNPREKPMNFTLEKGQSATFRYRIVFYTHAATEAELNEAADAFAAAYK